MRVLHLSTYDESPGAANFTHTLHTALRRIGVESEMLVGTKLGHDPTVHLLSGYAQPVRAWLRRKLDEWPLRRHRLGDHVDFSAGWLPGRVVQAARKLAPDVVHIHWVQHGFLSVSDAARLPLPVVWSLLDHWPFTGGCHYEGDCQRWQQECGACPVLRSNRPKDLSHRIWQAKARAWQKRRWWIVSLSEWSRQRAAASPLLRDHHHASLLVPIDTERWKPLPRAGSRSLLGLPADAFVVAMGAVRADAPRKGGHLAAAALRQWTGAQPGREVWFCVFGDGQLQLESTDKLHVRTLGRLSDTFSLRTVFSAADLMIVPSVADSGPRITGEALACGTPVLGFPVGIHPEILRNGINGYLAPMITPEALMAGLTWGWEARGNTDVRDAARRTALEQLDANVVAQRHAEIYARALNRKASSDSGR